MVKKGFCTRSFNQKMMFFRSRIFSFHNKIRPAIIPIFLVSKKKSRQERIFPSVGAIRQLFIFIRRFQKLQGNAIKVKRNPEDFNVYRNQDNTRRRPAVVGCITEKHTTPLGSL
jgi:hypothetical protein